MTQDSKHNRKENGNGNRRIHIGERMDSKPAEPPKIVTDNRALSPFIDYPWFRSYVYDKVGISLPKDESRRSHAVDIPDDVLARHTFICGSSGSGKTKLLELLVKAQISAGYSAVVIDQKFDTIKQIADSARQVGLSPDKVTVILPSRHNGIPGWNPLSAEDTPILHAVSDLVAVIEQTSTSWGPRLRDILTNSLIVLATHRLSLYELPRFLARESYRNNLLSSSEQVEPSLPFNEARDFFLNEFSQWTKSDRATAISPVMNKVRQLLLSPVILSLLCPARNTISLSRLWSQQRVMLIHLDRVVLGEDGSRLIAGLFSSALFRVAMRVRGKTPVVLCLDELATVERYIGAALCETLALARGYNLRLLTACQHLAQLSDDLREALLANTGLKAFFRLGYADARMIASALPSDERRDITHISVEAKYEDRRDHILEWVNKKHQIVDGYDNPIRYDPELWEQWQNEDDVLGAKLLSLCRSSAEQGKGRLYVRAADTDKAVEVREYVKDVSQTFYWLTGPEPIRLVTSCPKPKVVKTERRGDPSSPSNTARTLQELSVQCALVSTPGADPKSETLTVTRISNVTEAAFDENLHRYLNTAQRTSGQTEAEVKHIAENRMAEIERVCGPTIDETYEPPQGRHHMRRKPLSGRINAALRNYEEGSVADDGSIA